ncbi:hypothetical protein [Pseudonocardia alni]|uniref:hypothetical protein n=1 Tax=Pseudonocardia alni TaxID=33907 RepID=UPI00280C0615|nr:hypothetical protein [Pseudonocardia alni]
MYVWEQSEIVKAYTLTTCMVWALLGVGAVRPSTWAALMRRDLAEHASDGGHRLTATGQDVADELHNLTAEPEAATHGAAAEVVDVPSTPDTAPGVVPESITTDDGPTFPECHDAGAHVESDHETADCGWLPLWPNGAPAPRVESEPDPLNLVTADQIHSGDIVMHRGERHRIDYVSRSGGDVVLSAMRVLGPLPVDGVAVRMKTAFVTLTMSAGTRLRASQPEQLSLTA